MHQLFSFFWQKSTCACNMQRSMQCKRGEQHLLLQGSGGPVDGKMNVLEQHPAAIAVEVVKVVHSDGFLALSEGHRHVLAGVCGVSELAPEALHSGCDVHTGRQEHKHRHGCRSILQSSSPYHLRKHLVLILNAMC